MKRNGKITLEGLANKIDKVSDNLDNLAVITAKGFVRVDKRFEQVDKRFEHIESRFDVLENKVDRVETELSEVVNKVENLDVSLNRESKRANKRIDNLEEAVFVKT